jgi:hypothetical protein
MKKLLVTTAILSLLSAQAFAQEAVTGTAGTSGGFLGTTHSNESETYHFAINYLNTLTGVSHSLDPQEGNIPG